MIDCLYFGCPNYLIEDSSPTKNAKNNATVPTRSTHLKAQKKNSSSFQLPSMPAIPSTSWAQEAALKELRQERKHLLIELKQAKREIKMLRTEQRLNRSEIDGLRSERKKVQEALTGSETRDALDDIFNW